MTANIFSAPVGKARATPRELKTMKQVSRVWRLRLKGASSPASNTSKVYLHDICTPPYMPVNILISCNTANASQRANSRIFPTADRE